MNWDIAIYSIDGDRIETIPDTNTRQLLNVYHLALGFPFMSLSRMPCTQAWPHVRHGIRRMEGNPQRFNHCRNANGTASYEAVLDMLNKVLACCERNPTGILRIG